MIEILKLREYKELKHEAALWFHDKWHIDTTSYEQSIEECIAGNTIPQWYVAMDNRELLRLIEVGASRKLLASL